jgi:hypothetical protein
MNVETTSASFTTTTASALAPLLFRASPIDSLLRSAAAQADLEKYNNTAPSLLVDHRAPSPYPGTYAKEISRPSSTSTQSSNIALLRQHEYNNTREDPGPLNSPHYNHSLHAQHNHNHNLSLPGLSTLASLASASPSQLRYVHQDPLILRGFFSDAFPTSCI